MADDVSRWAAHRAPELLARAEAEAVDELKRALLEAALARTGAPARRRQAEPAEQTVKAEAAKRATAEPAVRAAAEPAVAAEPGPAGDGVWAYCVTRAGAPPSIEGVHGASVEPVEGDGLTAFVSRVPMAEFGEDPLRRNLNDLAWLERVAREHEAVLERALEAGTIVPLRICTIFEGEDGVARMLAGRRAALDAALDALEGRQEWGVKLIVDRAALERAAEAGMPPGSGDEIESSSAGGAYMLRRRHERRVREAADRLAQDLAEDVHARVQDWATDAVVNPPQNPELSGHEGEMLLNAAYLVETAKVERLHELVAELGELHSDLGARLELTGPWPPYNFVPRTESALA